MSKRKRSLKPSKKPEPKKGDPAYSSLRVVQIAFVLFSLEILLTRLLTRGQKRKRPPENGGRNPLLTQDLVAEPTGLEPATSDVTGALLSFKKFANL